MSSTNAGPEPLQSKPFVNSPTKGFWQPSFPTLATWQRWFVATPDTFSRRPRRLPGSTFRLDLTQVRFDMGCVGNGVRIAVFQNDRGGASVWPAQSTPTGSGSRSFAAGSRVSSETAKGLAATAERPRSPQIDRRFARLPRFFFTSTTKGRVGVS